MANKSRQIQLRLDGTSEPRPLPKRTVVPRRDGERGFTIAVLQPGSTCRIYVGVYSTRGEAWQAIRDGVGKQRPQTEAVSLIVRKK